MNLTRRSVRSFFGGCALGLAGLALSGCSGQSDGPNLLPLDENAAAATGAPDTSGTAGSRRHGRATRVPKQHIKTSEDADLSAKELRAKKLKAKGAAEGAQP